MKTIVTGGAGFIGGHIADALVARGDEVLVLDDLSTGRRENVPSAAEFAQIDIRDAAKVSEAVRDFRPEAICHQAAQASVSISVREPTRDAEVNVFGTLNLLRAATEHGVERFVYAATGGAVYGEVPEGEAATTAWVPQPISPYACSKLAGEHYLASFRHEHGLQATVLRYANVYGPRQDPHGEAGVVAIFAKRALAGQGLRVFGRAEPGDGGCDRDYVYVADVVRANVAALDGEDLGGTMNIGTGVATRTRTIAETIAREVGGEVTIETGPPRAGDLARSVLSPDAFVAKFGAPTALDQGFAETVAWFRAQHEAAS